MFAFQENVESWNQDKHIFVDRSVEVNGAVNDLIEFVE
jgi:hypothetical protein